MSPVYVADCHVCHGVGSLYRKPDGMTWREAEDAGRVEKVACKWCGGSGRGFVEVFPPGVRILGPTRD